MNHPAKLVQTMLAVLPKDFQMSLSDDRRSVTEYTTEELTAMIERYEKYYASCSMDHQLLVEEKCQ